jgi:aminoglycoside phosphotransferase (APT) family kinase protein
VTAVTSPVLTAAELATVREFLLRSGVAVDGPLTSRLVTGGRSNLTLTLDDGSSRWVLRTPPRAGLTPSAHDVTREFRVTKALEGTDVAVARAVALCEDPSLIGGPFAVAEFVEGRCVQTRAELDSLPEFLVDASVLRLVEMLAALHRVDHVAVGLEGFGRPDGYAARQLRRWSGQWPLVSPGDGETDAMAESLGRMLRDRVPEQRAVSVVHGDFRIDNALLRFHDDEVEVAAVVDWELSTIGDPVADVALMCVYRHSALDHILGAPSAWTSDRIPEAGRLAAAYESAGGATLADWDFHLALAYYKLAVIAAGIDHRYRAGAGSGPGFDCAALAVPELLESGLEAASRATTRGTVIHPARRSTP